MGQRAPENKSHHGRELWQQVADMAAETAEYSYLKPQRGSREHTQMALFIFFDTLKPLPNDILLPARPDPLILPQTAAK